MVRCNWTAIVLLNKHSYCLHHRLGRTSISSFTGPTWDPYWVVTALSPILIIMLFVKTILMIVSDGLFRKYCAIQVLAVMVCSDHQ